MVDEISQFGCDGRDSRQLIGKVTRGLYLYAALEISTMLSAMNTFEAHEKAAAEIIQERARSLVKAYAKSPDLAAARLAVLMIAAQNEARKQGITAPLVFSHEVQE